jgi:hypothetical protein
MSRYIYESKDGLGQLIKEAVDAENWNDIVHLTGGIVVASYHKYGYAIAAGGDTGEMVADIDILEVHNVGMVGKWKTRFMKDLEDVIVRCLKHGLINKNNWSAPLFNNRPQEVK